MGGVYERTDGWEGVEGGPDGRHVPIEPVLGSTRPNGSEEISIAPAESVGGLPPELDGRDGGGVVASGREDQS